MTTAEAYAVCSAIAQREAKNFYYSFRVLPEHKRNAMCAVYAFMRRADDISDDETLPVAERREVMARWLEEWRNARRSEITDDPVFHALNDTQKRFAIPDALLEDLVRGTTMDLEESQQDVVSVSDTTILKQGIEHEHFRSIGASMAYIAIAISWRRLWGWFVSISLDIAIHGRSCLPRGLAWRFS